MPILPADVLALLVCFAPLFSARVWRHVPLLVIGAILAPGQRTVAAALRVMGLGQVATFQTYHRVLNRAGWSSRQASQILFGLLVTTFAPQGPLVVGIDETIERRRGRNIAAAGIYRDPVRSSHSHFVKVRGLRWICAMLLVPIPWAGRTWALPIFTVLAPSEREAARRRRRYKPLTTWARQMIRQLHRWAVDRPLVVVGDRSYAALELLDAVRPVATVVARLRLDARLFAPPPPRPPHRKGRPRLVGERLPNLSCRRDDPTAAWRTLSIPRWYGERDRPVEVLSQTAVWYSTGFPPVPIRWVLIRDPRGTFPTQALLCTDLDAEPLQILSWFILRWQLEVTFHEVRAHLGVETQRQWSPRAILRTTPALLGLFSLVTLLAHTRMPTAGGVTRQAAWYTKATPTFVDALALVRRHLWARVIFQTALPETDPVT
jgi:DDE superfamily endonuclease